VNCGNENDRRFAEARMVADHRGELEAVEFRHAHVDENDSDIVLQEELQGFARRGCFDQVLVELAEDHLIGQKLIGLIVHQKDVDLFAYLGAGFVVHDCRLSGAATSAARTEAVRC
jgi:hypothetical protein